MIAHLYFATNFRFKLIFRSNALEHERLRGTKMKAIKNPARHALCVYLLAETRGAFILGDRLMAKGYKLTKEARENIRQSKLGKKNPFYGKRHSVATKLKMSQARSGSKNHMFGKHHPEEVREKIRQAQLGEKGHFYGQQHTAEAKRKISKAHIGNKWALGYKHTDASKAKMSIAQTGKRNPMFGKVLSKEQKEKISWLGKHHSEETKAKIRISHLGEKNYMFGRTGEKHHNFGKSVSEKQKQKQSDAMSGEKHWAFGKKGKDCHNFGKHANAETRAKMSKSRSGKRNPMFGVHRFGKESSNWKGGKSFEPYPAEFNIALKRRIRERDNYTCHICGKQRSKCVHHINYDKQDSRENNLITLCNKCHSRTNSNRDFWCNVLFTTLFLRREAI